MGDSDINVFVRANFIEEPSSLASGFQKKAILKSRIVVDNDPGFFATEHTVRRVSKHARAPVPNDSRLGSSSLNHPGDIESYRRWIGGKRLPDGPTRNRPSSAGRS